MQTDTDERLGLPSCSALERLENCPGSHRLSHCAIRDGMAPPAGEDAESGTRIHRWLETIEESAWDTMSHEEQQIAVACDDQCSQIVKTWRGDSQRADGIYRESRIGLTKYGTAAFVHERPDAAYIGTGKADLIVTQGKRALIVDYKTGRGDYQDADCNAQLRGLAGILGAMGFDEITVALVQPLAGKPSVAVFTETSLKEAAAWTSYVFQISQPANAPRCAGDWCKYCPARLICPEKRKADAAIVGALTQDGLPADSQREAIFARAYELPGEILADLAERVRMLKWTTAAIESAVRKALSEDGPQSAALRAAGWSLEEKEGNRKIANPQAVADAVAPLLVDAEGGSAAALLRCADLSAAKLTKEIQLASGPYRKANGDTVAGRYKLTAKAAAEALAAAAGDNLTRGTKRVLVRNGKELEDTP